MASARPTSGPQLREEDECPVCHQALPPKGPDGSETAREAHVESCIAAHFSSSGPGSARPPASAATAAAVAASAATPSQAAGSRPIPSGHRDSVGSSDQPSSSFQQRMRTPGMFVYHASEKDCVGQDGEGMQECVICFEEFAVGDEMGRLVCLCKFHRVSPPVHRILGRFPIVENTTKETDMGIRHVSGNGGSPKEQALALCINRLEMLRGFESLLGFI